MTTSPTFIERFNRAAGLAREGKFEEALKVYEDIHETFENSDESRIMTGEFMGVVEMRKAFCLMDLRRYEEAKKVFESEIMQATLGQFNFEILYDYYFSYGNTLGNLGLIEEMDKAMSNALNIAAEELDDLKRCENGWYWILYWAREHKKWSYLEEQCILAHKFGVNNESYYLQHIAGIFGCYAYRGLRKMEKARIGAEKILERLKEMKSSQQQIDEMETFLKSLDEIDKSKKDK